MGLLSLLCFIITRYKRELELSVPRSGLLLFFHWPQSPRRGLLSFCLHSIISQWSHSRLLKLMQYLASYKLFLANISIKLDIFWRIFCHIAVFYLYSYNTGFNPKFIQITHFIYLHCIPLKLKKGSVHRKCNLF